MVNANNKIEIKNDVVCPKCYKPLAGATLVDSCKDDYGRVLRNYYSWCLKCNQGFEVIQFLKCERWHIHKYRYYTAILKGDGLAPPANWQKVLDLPDPDPVVLGPGGDYRHGCELIAGDVKPLLESLVRAMEATSNVIKHFLQGQK